MVCTSALSIDTAAFGSGILTLPANCRGVATPPDIFSIPSGSLPACFGLFFSFDRNASVEF
jgi:hypothetical protein